MNLSLIYLALLSFSSSPSILCSPEKLEPTAIQDVFDSAAHMIKATPVETYQTLWTEQKVDLGPLFELGKLSSTESILSAIQSYGIEIGVAQTSTADIQAINNQISTRSAPGEKLLKPSQIERNKEIQKFQNQDPLMIKFTESFKSVPARGQFVPQGDRPYPGSPSTRAPTILLKDFASRTTILHEFTHYLIGEARKRSGTQEPGTETSGEELDVYRIIIDNREKLGIADDTEGLMTSLANYETELNEIKSKGGDKQKIAESEAWLTKTKDHLINGNRIANAAFKKF